MATQAGGDLMDPGAVEDVDRGVPQQGHHGRPLTSVNEAGIFAKGDVFAPVQVVLDGPMAPFEREQPRWIGLVRGQAGDAVVERPFVAPVFVPGALQAKDLGMTEPIEVADKISGGDQFAPLVRAAVPVVARVRRPPVEQG